MKVPCTVPQPQYTNPSDKVPGSVSGNKSPLIEGDGADRSLVPQTWQGGPHVSYALGEEMPSLSLSRLTLPASHCFGGPLVPVLWEGEERFSLSPASIPCMVAALSPACATPSRGSPT